MTKRKQTTFKQKPTPEDFVERVIVKFVDGVRLPYEKGVEKAIMDKKLGPIKELIKKFPKISFGPLFTSIAPNRIHSLVNRARALDPSYNPPDFLAFYAIETPKGTDRAALVKQLISWDTVDYAYEEPRVSDPGFHFPPPGFGPEPPPPPEPNDDPEFSNQGYLKQAPDGIGAIHAWGVRGGAGFGVKMVDIEKGWKIDYEFIETLNTVHIDTHEDLPGDKITLLSGFLDRWSTPGLAHGTSTLGVIAAVDNNIGCIGIAPHVSEIGLVSYRRTPVRNAQGEPVASVFSQTDAILDAIDAMDIGDVLLLEMQISIFGLVKVPAELDPASFEVIRCATALGIVVVEAAGNGGVDLDTVTIPFATIEDRKKNTRESIVYEVIEGHPDWIDLILGNRPLNRSNVHFRDSGAIVVGAGSSTTPRTRMGFSCYGSRIDCHAWGENVQTLTTNLTGESHDYGHFNGTSSASAIIAGVVVATQGMSLEHLRRSLSPREMREILSKPVNTPQEWMRPTPTEDPDEDRIAVMPNLVSIIIHLNAMIVSGE